MPDPGAGHEKALERRPLQGFCMCPVRGLEFGGLGRNRTTDTRIFNAFPALRDARVLSQLQENQALSAQSAAIKRSREHASVLVSRRDHHNLQHKNA
jgi:hypothetical protein